MKNLSLPYVHNFFDPRFVRLVVCTSWHGESEIEVKINEFLHPDQEM